MPSCSFPFSPATVVAAFGRVELLFRSGLVLPLLEIVDVEVFNVKQLPF